MKRRMIEERCKNYGGYDIVRKSLWCPLLNKQCAGYDRKCQKFQAARLLKSDEVVH
jgi:hypothetical protein